MNPPFTRNIFSGHFRDREWFLQCLAEKLGSVRKIQYLLVTVRAYENRKAKK